MALSKDINDYPQGIVLPVDKPYRWTSADAIRKIKWHACRHFGKKNLKVGHAGTLDPLATGILLICIGPATRQAETLQHSDKEYIATVCFGATTPSYDLEKDIDEFYPYEQITEESIREMLKGFLGPQEQVAPLFSAKQVDGKRAYELARSLYKKGGNLDEEADKLLSRQNIVITELELLEFAPHGFGFEHALEGLEDSKSGRINVAKFAEHGLPEARIRVGCTKGTYIRALARDWGEALGSGAFLSGLRRTKNGGFEISDSKTIDQALEMFSAEK